MKKLIFTTLFTLFLGFSMAQEAPKTKSFSLPSVDIKTIDGKSFNTKDIQNDGKPIIICFFATWCKPCMVELKSIAEVYDDWQDETGVKIYAVSIDDSRSSAKVLPLVNGNAWDYEVLLDENQDFKRALNVNDIPHTFILNANKEVVWQHASYAPGVEQEYIEIVKKLLEEKP
ncbi:MAG: TlpA disulfide reductase family protein [Bacteroidales bacterium]|nr:TlpA disulfide reductase family protein [Bacteroidales bacterium]